MEISTAVFLYLIGVIINIIIAGLYFEEPPMHSDKEKEVLFVVFSIVSWIIVIGFHIVAYIIKYLSAYIRTAINSIRKLKNDWMI